MKHKYKTRAALTLALTLTLTQAPAVSAEGSSVPSIIVNDDEWYRDGASPLTFRDGRYYVPAEVFTMFDYVRVTQPKDGNLLIINTTDGRYISILYMEQKAAVNGRIYENTGVFRRSEKYYVDAQLTAEALGISCETYTGTGETEAEAESGTNPESETASETESNSESAPESTAVLPAGTTVLRLYDRNRVFSFADLISSYVTGNYGEDETDSVQPDEPLYFDEDGDGYEYSGDYDSTGRRIYVLCSTEKDSTGLFAAMDALEDEGLDYTAALDESSSAEPDYVMSKLIMGEVLVMPEGYADERNTAGLLYMTEEEEISSYAASLADKMDKINNQQMEKSGRSARFTLTSHNPKIDEILSGRGYFPIVPDYEINGASYPEGVVSEIEKRLADGGSVTVYLSDCWSSTHMAELLWDMAARGYDVLALGGE